MATDQDRDWIFPLVEISQDKRVPRTSTGINFANELTGVDGALQGGLMPQGGFFEVQEIDPTSGGGNLDAAGAAQYNQLSYVHDFFPVTFFLGSDNFAYGYVYRVSRTISLSTRTIGFGTYDVLIDYYNKETNSFRKGLVLAEDVSGTAEMSVETFGPLGYVFIKGEAPIRFYVQKKGPLVSQLSTTTTDGTEITAEYYSTTTNLGAISGTPARAATCSVTVDASELENPTAATTSITVTGTISTTRALSITDAEGNAGTITASDSTNIAAGAASGNIFSNRGTTTQQRSAITAAINNLGSVKITAADDGVTTNKTNLTQDIGGAEGNTAISHNLDNTNTINAFANGDEDEVVLVSSDGTSYKFRVHATDTSTEHTEGIAFFKKESSDSATAVNLRVAIDANKKFTAVGDLSNVAKVNITQVTKGTAGNKTNSSAEQTGSSGFTVTNFTGGKDGPKGPSEVVSNDTGPGLRPVLYSPEETNPFKVMEIKVGERHTDEHTAWAKISLLDVDPIPIWDLKYKVGTQGYFQFDRDLDYLVTLFEATNFGDTEFTTDYLTTEAFTMEYTTDESTTRTSTFTSAAESGTEATSGTRATAIFDFTAGPPTLDKTVIIVSSDTTSKTYTAKNSETAGSLEFNRSGSGTDAATSLKNCIENAAGHGSKLLCSLNGAILTVTQASFGDGGNTSITGTLRQDMIDVYGTNFPSAFSGGVDGTTQTTTSTSTTTLLGADDLTATTSLLMTETFNLESDEIVRTPKRLEKGGYVMAVQFANSYTGLKSSVSEFAQLGTSDFQNVVSDESSSDDDPGSTVVNSLFAGIHMQYDREKWDRAFIYRSVRTEDAGGTLTASVLHLDKIIKLDEYELKDDATLYPEWKVGADIRNAIYYFELEDKQLIFQEPYLDQTYFDKTMPFGGAGKLFEGTMLVSNITGTPQTVDNSTSQVYRNIGEFRWSSLTESNPELFPVGNYYLPEEGNSSVVVFEKAASNMLAFSKDRVYHIRKVASGVGGFLRVNEIHKGYGVVNPKAACSVGNTIYFLTTKGLKTLDSSGRLDDVKSVDQLIVDDWKDNLDKCELHFDPVVSCVYMLNPTLEEMVCFWFNTGKITMMKDVPFTTAGTGFFPSDRGLTSASIDYDGSLEKRVMFVQNIKLTNSSDLHENYPYVTAGGDNQVVSDWKPKVWVYDHKKENAQTRLLLTGEDVSSRASNIVIASVATGTTVNSVQKKTIVLDSIYLKTSDNYKYLYTTDNANGDSTTGDLKFLILSISNNSPSSGKQTITLHPEGHSTSPTAGDFVILSPIPFEYVGHPLVDIAADGVINPMDFHSVKFADSIGVAISDISNTSVDFKQVRSEVGVYEGNATTALASGKPLKTDGTPDSGFANNLGGGTFISIGGTTGTQSTSLVPFFKAKVVDLTFRLISVLVSGKILGTYNRNHPGV